MPHHAEGVLVPRWGVRRFVIAGDLRFRPQTAIPPPDPNGIGSNRPRMSEHRAVAHGPGRVNLIGEHTDYNDGLALPFAVELGVTVRAEAIDGDVVVALAPDIGEEDVFPLAAPPAVTGWRAFVRGTVAELRAAGHTVPAARLEIEGALDRGAGLSSSAALEAALCLALIALGAGADAVDRLDRVELARLCSRVEHDWVGAETGLLDQLASLCGNRDGALLIDFRGPTLRAVALELGQWKLCTLDSGAEHSHAHSGYNERRAECRAACEALGIGSLREATRRDLDCLPDPLDRRARHVLEENERVERAVEALGGGDLAALGALLDSSHASLRDLYDTSVPEVERTVARVKAAGAVGARMMGGGFGGVVLALFPPDVTPPGDAVRVLSGPGARLL